jgi:hypothetical protein
LNNGPDPWSDGLARLNMDALGEVVREADHVVASHVPQVGNAAAFERNVMEARRADRQVSRDLEIESIVQNWLDAMASDARIEQGSGDIPKPRHCVESSEKSRFTAFEKVEGLLWPNAA